MQPGGVSGTFSLRQQLCIRQSHLHGAHAQARAHVERAVKEVRRFRVFNGRPLDQDSWLWLDSYLNVVMSLIKMNGPLSARTDGACALLC